MKTIIIDDEFRAIEMLEFFLNEFFPDFDIVGKYTKGSDGLAGIIQHDPEILFLDIHMPEETGISLFEKIGAKNRITIFVSAHKDYALDAIHLGAFDYILKPVSREDLGRVYNRIKNERSNSQRSIVPKIRIKISNRHYLFEKDEIINISSEGNYTTLYFEGHRPLIVTKNLKKVQMEYFSEPPFFRVHQSNLVNLNHIVEFSTDELVLSNDEIIPISANRNKLLKEILSKKKHFPKA